MYRLGWCWWLNQPDFFYLNRLYLQPVLPFSTHHWFMVMRSHSIWLETDTVGLTWHQNSKNTILDCNNTSLACVSKPVCQPSLTMYWNYCQMCRQMFYGAPLFFASVSSFCRTGAMVTSFNFTFSFPFSSHELFVIIHGSVGFVIFCDISSSTIIHTCER